MTKSERGFVSLSEDEQEEGSEKTNNPQEK